jgi:hypothetical protein
MRTEFAAIATSFGLLPTLGGNANQALVVNGSANGVTTTTGTLALAGNFATTGAYNLTLALTASITLNAPAVSGLTIATLTGTETLTNKTLTSPAITGPVTVTGTLTVTSTESAAGYNAGGSFVVGIRQTGWTAGTGGTPNLGAMNYGTATLAQLANRVMALEQALYAGVGPHGLIGA